MGFAKAYYVREIGGTVRQVSKAEYDKARVGNRFIKGVRVSGASYDVPVRDRVTTIDALRGSALQSSFADKTPQPQKTYKIKGVAVSQAVYNKYKQTPTTKKVAYGGGVTGDQLKEKLLQSKSVQKIKQTPTRIKSAFSGLKSNLLQSYYEAPQKIKETPARISRSAINLKQSAKKDIITLSKQVSEKSPERAWRYGATGVTAFGEELAGTFLPSYSPNRPFDEASVVWDEIKLERYSKWKKQLGRQPTVAEYRSWELGQYSPIEKVGGFVVGATLWSGATQPLMETPTITKATKPRVEKSEFIKLPEKTGEIARKEGTIGEVTQEFKISKPATWTKPAETIKAKSTIFQSEPVITSQAKEFQVALKRPAMFELETPNLKQVGIINLKLKGDVLKGKSIGGITVKDIVSQNALKRSLEPMEIGVFKSQSTFTKLWNIKPSGEFRTVIKSPRTILASGTARNVYSLEFTPKLSKFLGEMKGVQPPYKTRWSLGVGEAGGYKLAGKKLTPVNTRALTKTFSVEYLPEYWKKTEGITFTEDLFKVPTKPKIEIPKIYGKKGQVALERPRAPQRTIQITRPSKAILEEKVTGFKTPEVTTVEAFKILPRQLTKTFIKQSYRGGLPLFFPISKTRLGTLTSYGKNTLGNITQVTKGLTNISQASSTYITPKLTTRTITRVSSSYYTPPLFEIPKISIPSIPTLPTPFLPRFFAPRLPSSFKRITSKQPKRYQPSVAAFTLRIFGKKPRILTGVGLRPIPKGYKILAFK